MSTLKEIQKYNNINEDDLENVKLSLMASHPFIFLRGTDEIYFDFISKEKFLNHDIFSDETLRCWSSNDSHITNFGFSNVGCSTNSEVHYEINDYDEAFYSNPFYDIIRLASSLYYYVEEYNLTIEEEHPDEFINLKPSEFVNLFLDTYKETLKSKDFNIKWDNFPFMSKMKKKSEKKMNNEDAGSRFQKYTVKKKDKMKLNTDSNKLEKLDKAEKKDVIKSLEKVYGSGKIVDVAKRKTAGVGSSHLDRYYFLLEKKGDFVLMEIKEQISPVHLNYLEEYNDRYKEQSQNKDFGHIHHESIKRMVGEDYDYNMQNVNYKGKNFISRTSFNAKLKVGVEDIFPKDMDVLTLKSNLKEYIKLAANRLSRAHYNSVDNNIDNKEEAQKVYRDNLLEKIENNDETIKGMIKSVYNHIDIKYSQFLREYYLKLGQSSEKIKLKNKDILESSTTSGKNKSSITTKHNNKN